MEAILNNIYNLKDTIVRSDPAIYRIIFFDSNGNEIYQYAKTWDKINKYKTVGPMISQIFKNADKFFGFMKKNFYDKFVFYWFFENTKIIAVDSDYGFIAVLCENDVDLGFVKTVLVRKAIPIYKKIIKPITE